MCKPILSTTVLAAAALFVLGALVPPMASAQQPQQPQQGQQLAPPKAYKPVPIKLPQPVADPTFETFRKQLLSIAEKKDRAALARLVATNFFWIAEDNKDVADKSKSPIENLAKAIGLDGRDPPGWDTLAGYAGETTADPMSDRQGVICGPGEPQIDDKAFEELINATQTDATEWGYPVGEGIEVRSGAEKTAPVSEKLGLYLVRAYPDETPEGAVHNEVIRIVTPSGKLGFIPIDSLLPIATDQLCYSKEGNAWRIAGVIGGGTPGQ